MANVVLTGTLAAIPRSDLTQESLAKYVVPWEALRIFDAYATDLTGTASSDDLGLIGGTFASASPMVKTSTPSGTSITQKTRFCVQLPPEYVSAARVKLRVHARVEVAANVSATVDFSAYESNKEGGISADLVTTAATSINAITWADVDFEITATSLVAGDVLDVQMTLAINDTGATNAALGNIGSIELLCDIKG